MPVTPPYNGLNVSALAVCLSQPITDAVYACTKGTIFEKQISDNHGNISFYVLGPDLEARGLDNSNLTNNIEIIDYKGFVKLVADNEKTQNWL